MRKGGGILAGHYGNMLLHKVFDKRQAPSEHWH